jgi:predicted transcriptional regulator
MVATEKVTFNIEKELKVKMLDLKKDMSKSLSALYNQAIQEFIERREVAKWEKASELASKDSDYLKTIEFGEDSGEFYDY